MKFKEKTNKLQQAILPTATASFFLKPDYFWYNNNTMQPLNFNSIKDFYPFYLTQHREFRCRTLHFLGTGLVIGIFIATLATQTWWLLLLMPLIGYGLAWTGHFMFEKNKPAAFKNPLWSLACDFIMFWHIITGQIGKKIQEAEKLFPEYCN